ncbi:MAG TPA: gamma-glutamyl-gamma-aminobutyrate hydrolase family protein [Allosphingosinicella sp.]|jgi:putative glutamine amidotransferase
MKKFKKVKNNKKIGIVAHFTGANSFGISKPYLDFFRHFGEVVLITPYDVHIRDLDLLVLPGGPDVAPWRYMTKGDELNLAVGPFCPVRERFDQVLLPKYIEAETPIFGICRGHQTLAVEFGAKLVQDMWHESNPDHDGAKKMHEVEVLNDMMFDIANIEFKNFEVNSRHHQTVENCPENGRVIAVYNGKFADDPTEKHIEAITYFPNYPAHTVQWHPEDARDQFSIQLIGHLLSLSNEEVQVN